MTKTPGMTKTPETNDKRIAIFTNFHEPRDREYTEKEINEFAKFVFVMFLVAFVVTQVLLGFDALYLPGDEWDPISFIFSILTFVSISILVFMFLNSTASDKGKLYVGWSYLLFVFVLILAYVIAGPTKQDPPKQDPPKQDPVVPPEPPVVPPEPPVVTPPPPKPVVTSKPVQQSSTAVQIALAIGIPLTLLVLLWWLYNKRSKQKYANASPGVTVAQSVTAAPRVTARRARKKNHRAHKKIR